jgi:DNA-binding NtrC family response regulator
VLQEKCIQRVGGRETISVDVRVIAATHRDLEAMMQARQFREDLFYRLSVVVIKLPPLRDRREDIPVLVRHFLGRFAAELEMAPPTITNDALDVLQTQPWPGNIRELENTTRRLLFACRGLAINGDLVQAALSAAPVTANLPGRSLAAMAADLLIEAKQGRIDDAHARLLGEAERELITQAIALADGNQAKASRWLGISRITLREKLRQFGLHPADAKEQGE